MNRLQFLEQPLQGTATEQPLQGMKLKEYKYEKHAGKLIIKKPKEKTCLLTLNIKPLRS